MHLLSFDEYLRLPGVDLFITFMAELKSKTDQLQQTSDYFISGSPQTVVYLSECSVQSCKDKQDKNRFSQSHR